MGDRRFEIVDLWVSVGAAVLGWALAGLPGMVVVVAGISFGWRRPVALAGLAALAALIAAGATVDAAGVGWAFTERDHAAAQSGLVAGMLLIALVTIAVLHERVVRRVRWPAVAPRPRDFDVVALSRSLAVASCGAGLAALVVGIDDIAVAAAVAAAASLVLGSSKPVRRLAEVWRDRPDPERSAESQPDAGHASSRGHIVKGSSWVMLGFVAQAATGVLFWIAAARLFPAEDVGLATGLFTSLQFVNFLTTMGTPELLSRYHPAEGGRDPWLSWSVLTTVATSFIGSIVYVGFVGTGTLRPLETVGLVAGLTLFFCLSAGSAVTALVDARFMTGRRWILVFWRLLVIGAVRIPLLWLPHGSNDALWIFVVMAGPIAASGLWGLWRLHAAGLRPSLTVAPEIRPGALRFSGVNYLAHLALLAPQFGLPVIVFLNVTPESNAAFFLAWSIAAVASILPMTVSRVLLAEGSRDDAELDALAATALRLALAVIAVATLVALPAERIVVAVYGADYRDAGAILPVLIAGCLPWSVAVVSLGYSRVRQDHVGTVFISGTVAVSVIGIALGAVPERGLDGGAEAWLIGNGLAAVAATASYLRLRRRRRTEIAVAVHEGEGERDRESVAPR